MDDDNFKFDRHLNITDMRALSAEIPEDFDEGILNEMWNNDRSDDFYRGLMNGILAALSFQEQAPELDLVRVAAYVASVLERKEII